MRPKHDRQPWLDTWLQLAEAGQLDAPIAVGWEYFRGELTSQDLATAERWFMAAEANRAEAGYFQLTKMLTLLGNDERLGQIFARCQWKTGPMAYLHARHLKTKGADLATIVSRLKLGAEVGHIPCKILLLQHNHPGWRRAMSLPSEIPLLVRFIRIWLRDSDDERVAH